MPKKIPTTEQMDWSFFFFYFWGVVEHEVLFLWIQDEQKELCTQHILISRCVFCRKKISMERGQLNLCFDKHFMCLQMHRDKLWPKMLYNTIVFAVNECACPKQIGVFLCSSPSHWPINFTPLEVDKLIKKRAKINQKYQPSVIFDVN